MGGYTIASNYPHAVAKCKIKALISYSKDTVKQPLLSLQRVAGLKVSKSVFVEMFSTETGGNGSSPPAMARRCCNAVFKKHTGSSAQCPPLRAVFGLSRLMLSKYPALSTGMWEPVLSLWPEPQTHYILQKS